MLQLIEALNRISRYIKKEVVGWYILFEIFDKIIIRALSIIDLFRDMVGIKLVGVIEESFDAVFGAIHEALDFLIYRPVFQLVRVIFVQIGFMFNFSIKIPNLEVPDWYSSLVVFSFLLLRSERSAMKAFAPNNQRIHRQKNVVEKVLWGAIWITWKPIDLVTKSWKQTFLFRVGRLIKTISSAVFLHGVLFFIHDIWVTYIYWRSSEEKDRKSVV